MSDILQRAKAWQSEICSNSQSNTIYQEFCAHKYHEMVRLLPELVAECERLQTDNKYLRDRWAGQSATIVDMQIELVRWQKISIREKAERDLLFLECWNEEDRKAAYLKAARELGIDSSDSQDEYEDCPMVTPRGAKTAMILTSKQRAELEAAIKSYDADIFDLSGEEYEGAIRVREELKLIRAGLRSILDQSRSGWEITEERKIAMKQVLTLLTGGQPKDLHWDMRAIAIFKDLLAEAEGKI